MLWYRELGFDSNPLSIKPAAFRNSVVGYDLEEVFDKIDNGQIVFVEGKYGFGKTTILKSIISRYGGRGELVYYNRNRADSSISIEQLLKGGKGFFGRLFGGLPDDMILLLDEVEDLAAEDQKDIMQFHAQGNIRAIVFFGPRFEDARFDVELQKLMINNVIQLTPLTDEEAVELVRERVGNISLIPDRIIVEVFRHADRNPRKMLEYLEDLCKYAFDNNEEEITEEHLKDVLGISKLKVKPKKKSAPKKQEKPKKPKKEIKPPKPEELEEHPRHEPEDDHIEVIPADEDEDFVQEYPDEEKEDVEYFYY